MAFDVEGALKAGYSEADIASYLAGQRGFDLEGARKAGYSDSDIVTHLVNKPAPKAEPKPEPKKAAPAEGAYGFMGENIEDTTAIKPSRSVMDTAKPSPVETPSFAPLRPEVRRAIEAKYDAASPKQRAELEQAPGAVGDVIRQRAQEYKRSEKAPEYAKKKLSPAAEERAQRLIEQGEKPAFATAAGARAAELGATPGKEIQAIQAEGALEPTQFDFEINEQYKNANPVIRGAMAGWQGYKQGALGINQAVSDLLGADEFAASFGKQAAEARNVVQSMGENPVYAGRMFEGAINSIAQQLPALIGGVATGSEALVLGSMFAQTFGQEYSEGTAKGLMGSDAAARAGLFAAFEVVGEKLGLKFQMDKIRQATQGMSKDVLKGWLGNTLKKELPGELSTTTGQFLTDLSPIGLRPDANLGDYLQQVGDTTVQTFMQSGLMAGGAKVLSKGVEALGGRAPEATVEDSTRQLVEQYLQKGAAPSAPPTPEAPAEAAAPEPIPAPAPTPAPVMAEAPAEDPQVQALTQAYIAKGFAPEDAQLIAQQDVGALIFPVTGGEGRAIQRQSPEDEARTMAGRAERTMLQMEGENVPSTEPPSFVTEPSTGEYGAEMPSGRERAAGRPESPIERGLDAASRVVRQSVGREESERAALENRKQRSFEWVSGAFREEAYPDLSPILGESWVRSTLAKNPTPDEYQEAAYARLEELDGARPADVAPIAERRVPATEVVAEQPEVRAEPAAEAAPTEAVEAPTPTEVIKPVEEETRGPEAPKAVEAKEERPEEAAAPAAERAAPELELEAFRNADLEVEPEVIQDTVAKAENITSELKAAPRVRKAGAGRKKSEEAKSEAERKAEAQEIINLARDIQAEVSMATKLAKPEVVGLSAEEVNYRDGIREMILDGLYTSLYGAAQEFKRRPIAAYAAADKYIRSLTPAQRERAKGLWEGTIEPKEAPPEPKVKSSKRQRKAALETLKAAEEEAEQPRLPTAKPEFKAPTEKVKKVTAPVTEAFGNPVWLAEYQGLWSEQGAKVRESAKQPEEKTRWTDANAAFYRKLFQQSARSAATSEEVKSLEPIGEAQEDVQNASIHEQLDEEDKAVIAEHYGETSYNETAKRKFVDDVVLAMNEGLDAVSRVLHDIIKRLQAGMLAAIMVFNTSFMTPTIPVAMPTKVTKTVQVRAKVPADVYGMSEGGKQAYETLYPALAKGLQATNKLFIITDKPSATVYVFKPDGKLLIQSKVLLGKTPGDYYRGNTEIVQNRITPAGLFNMGLRDAARGGSEAKTAGAYDYGKVFVLDKAIDGEYSVTLFHSVWTKEKDAKQRLAALEKPGPEDSRYSFGCINVPKAVYGNLLAGHETQIDGAKLFIVPENPAHTMEFINGKAAAATDIARQKVEPATTKVTEQIPSAPAKEKPEFKAAYREEKKAPRHAMPTRRRKGQTDADKERDAEDQAFQQELDISGDPNPETLLDRIGALNVTARTYDGLKRYLVANVRTLNTKVLETFLPLVPRDTVFRMAEGADIPRMAEVERLFRDASEFRHRLLGIAEKTGKKWILLDRKQRRLLGEVMHASTIERVDPSKNTSNPELNNMWARLNDSAKQVYEEARDFYETNRKLVFAIMMQNINNSTMNPASKMEMMARLQKMYDDAKVIQPYFPLMRYGQYWMQTGKGNQLVFRMFEGAKAKELAVQEFLRERRARGDFRSEEKLRADGELSDGNDIKTLRAKMADKSNLLKDIFRMLNESDLSEESRNSLTAEVYQMHLMTLPENSFQKAFIRRKDRKGYSEDALRNFSVSSVRMSQQITNIKYGPRIRNALDSAAASVEGTPDRARSEMIIEQVRKRYDENLKPSDDADSVVRAAVKTATKVGYLFYMTRIRHVVANVWAVPSRTVPVLSKYFGVVAAHKSVSDMFGKEMLNQIGVTRKDEQGNITYTLPSFASSKVVRADPELVRVVQKMLYRGITSQDSQTYNLLLQKRAATMSKPGLALEYANRVLGSLNHGSERLVRELTFLNAYKLARTVPIRGQTKVMSEDEAFDFAHDITEEALYNYSNENAPAWMKNTAFLLPANFKKWAMFTGIYYIRNIKAMIDPLPKETRRGAALALAESWIMGMLGAGVKGAFGVSMALLGYSFARHLLQFAGFGGDEDDDDFLKNLDIMKWFTEVAIPKRFGNIKIGDYDVSDILRSGVFNTVTGGDIASSISEGDLLFREMPDEAFFDNLPANLVAGYFGATGSIVTKMRQAAKDWNEGDWRRALSGGLPSIAGDIATAYRYTEDGARTRNLDVKKYPEEFTKMELLMQVLGYKPADLARLEEIDALYNKKVKEVSAHKTDLMRRLFKAEQLGDEKLQDKVLDEMLKFNKQFPHPDLRIDAKAYSDYRDGKVDDKRKMLRGLKLDEKFYEIERIREKSLADMDKAR